MAHKQIAEFAIAHFWQCFLINNVDKFDLVQDDFEFDALVQFQLLSFQRLMMRSYAILNLGQHQRRRKC